MTRSKAAVALAVLCAVTACESKAKKHPSFASWEAALTEVRAGLEARQNEWGTIPTEPAKRRLHLGQLAAYARTTLGWARIHPPPRTPEGLATYLPGAVEALEPGEAQARTYPYYGWSYAVATRRYRHGEAVLWLDVIDTSASIELVTPFEVMRVAARHESGGPYQAFTLRGFPAVRAEQPEASPGAARHSVEVLVKDRILVVARGDGRARLADLERLVSAVDLESLAATTA